ncbi:hypothetical protein UQW22_10745 [Isoptericola halotolerans]|uniref:hypothetical protein n=1 Tax=Isoptericola halotolerans TaxID=300560 RepID=UPI00388FDB3D
MTGDQLAKLRSTLDIEAALPRGLSKVWIYKDRVLAADYRAPSGVAFAFDLTVEGTVVHVAIAPRNDESRTVVRKACANLVAPLPGTRKLQLASAGVDEDDLEERVLRSMLQAHEAIFAAEVPRVDDVDDGSWQHEGVTVNFVRRAPKADCDQIVVVFTSIRNVRMDVDFDGPEGKYLANNRAELVFVHDDHAEAFCYYFGTGRDDQVARAITEFVRELARQRGVGLDRVVLAGMSKGGVAALIVGARLPGATVVSLVPQFAIGAYLAGRTEAILETIAGDRTEESVAWLDQVVPDALANAVNRDGRYYLLTGPGDRNCFAGLVSHARSLRRLAHLHVISAVSPRATDHFGTLKYLLPTMIALLGVLGSGLRPDLGLVSVTTASGAYEPETVGDGRSLRGPVAKLRRGLAAADESWRKAAHAGA